MKIETLNGREEVGCFRDLQYNRALNEIIASVLRKKIDQEYIHIGAY